MLANPATALTTQPWATILVFDSQAHNKSSNTNSRVSSSHKVVNHTAFETVIVKTVQCSVCDGDPEMKYITGKITSIKQALFSIVLGKDSTL